MKKTIFLKKVEIDKKVMSNNEKLVRDKCDSNCQQKLSEVMKTFETTSNQILTDLKNWHKQAYKRNARLTKAQTLFEDKKKQTSALEHQLHVETSKSRSPSRQSIFANASSTYSDVSTLQSKLTDLRSELKEAKDQYTTAERRYRAFRLKFDSVTGTLLEQLEQTGFFFNYLKKKK
ncbi:hypothetical protein RFI_06730 [Reticulomyxa filosa]|uniref:Uncharacterized protein n=1 Tax=Reticulomyxa filosa TaxID=46433 RepID=X6NYQ2_RETFI|nr:hypothetical protein RFI_06730 [Reticulomyxa filosa]|eukprot:ETO30392.1 hypothetical protein RFI_06730 [Reticulomyxa filosa]